MELRRTIKTLSSPLWERAVEDEPRIATWAVHARTQLGVRVREEQTVRKDLASALLAKDGESVAQLLEFWGAGVDEKDLPPEGRAGREFLEACRGAEANIQRAIDDHDAIRAAILLQSWEFGSSPVVTVAKKMVHAWDAAFQKLQTLARKPREKAAKNISKLLEPWPKLEGNADEPWLVIQMRQVKKIYDDSLQQVKKASGERNGDELEKLVKSWAFDKGSISSDIALSDKWVELRARARHVFVRRDVAGCLKYLDELKQFAPSPIQDDLQGLTDEAFGVALANMKAAAAIRDGDALGSLLESWPFDRECIAAEVALHLRWAELRARAQQAISAQDLEDAREVQKDLQEFAHASIHDKLQEYVAETTFLRHVKNAYATGNPDLLKNVLETWVGQPTEAYQEAAQEYEGFVARRRVALTAWEGKDGQTLSKALNPMGAGWCFLHPDEGLKDAFQDLKLYEKEHDRLCNALGSENCDINRIQRFVDQWSWAVTDNTYKQASKMLTIYSIRKRRIHAAMIFDDKAVLQPELHVFRTDPTLQNSPEAKAAQSKMKSFKQNEKLFDAVKKGITAPELKLLLTQHEQGADRADILARDSDGNWALHFAQDALVEELIDLDPSIEKLSATVPNHNDDLALVSVILAQPESKRPAMLRRLRTCLRRHHVELPLAKGTQCLEDVIGMPREASAWHHVSTALAVASVEQLEGHYQNFERALAQGEIGESWSTSLIRAMYCRSDQPKHMQDVGSRVLLVVGALGKIWAQFHVASALVVQSEKADAMDVAAQRRVQSELANKHCDFFLRALDVASRSAPPALLAALHKDLTNMWDYVGISRVPVWKEQASDHFLSLVSHDGGGWWLQGMPDDGWLVLNPRMWIWQHPQLLPLALSQELSSRQKDHVLLKLQQYLVLRPDVAFPPLAQWPPFLRSPLLEALKSNPGDLLIVLHEVFEMRKFILKRKPSKLDNGGTKVSFKSSSEEKPVIKSLKVQHERAVRNYKRAKNLPEPDVLAAECLWFWNLLALHAAPAYSVIGNALKDLGGTFVPRQGLKTFESCWLEIQRILAQALEELPEVGENLREELRGSLLYIPNVLAATFCASTGVLKEAHNLLSKLSWAANGVMLLRVQNEFHESVHPCSPDRHIKAHFAVRVPLHEAAQGIIAKREDKRFPFESGDAKSFPVLVEMLYITPQMRRLCESQKWMRKCEKDVLNVFNTKPTPLDLDRIDDAKEVRLLRDAAAQQDKASLRRLVRYGPLPANSIYKDAAMGALGQESAGEYVTDVGIQVAPRVDGMGIQAAGEYVEDQAIQVGLPTDLELELKSELEEAMHKGFVLEEAHNSTKEQVVRFKRQSEIFEVKSLELDESLHETLDMHAEYEEEATQALEMERRARTDDTEAHHKDMEELQEVCRETRRISTLEHQAFCKQVDEATELRRSTVELRETADGLRDHLGEAIQLHEQESRAVETESRALQEESIAAKEESRAAKLHHQKTKDLSKQLQTTQDDHEMMKSEMTSELERLRKELDLRSEAESRAIAEIEWLRTEVETLQQDLQLARDADARLREALEEINQLRSKLAASEDANTRHQLALADLQLAHEEAGRHVETMKINVEHAQVAKDESEQQAMMSEAAEVRWQMLAEDAEEQKDNALNESMQSLTAKMSALESERAAEEHASQLEDNLSILHTQECKAQSLNHELGIALDRFHTEHAELDLAAKNLREELELKAENIEVMSSQVRTTEAQVAEKEVTVSELCADLEKFCGDFHNAEQNIVDLEQRLEDARESIRQSRDDCVKLESDNVKLEGDNVKLESNLEEAHKVRCDLESTLEEARGKIKQLEEAQQLLQQELADVKQTLEEANSQHAQDEAETEKQAVELSEHIAHEQELEQQLEVYSVEYEKAQKAYQEANQAIDKLEGDNEYLQEELDVAHELTKHLEGSTVWKAIKRSVSAKHRHKEHELIVKQSHDKFKVSHSTSSRPSLRPAATLNPLSPTSNSTSSPRNSKCMAASFPLGHKQSIQSSPSARSMSPRADTISSHSTPMLQLPKEKFNRSVVAESVDEKNEADDANPSE